MTTQQAAEELAKVMTKNQMEIIEYVLMGRNKLLAEQILKSAKESFGKPTTRGE